MCGNGIPRIFSTHFFLSFPRFIFFLSLSHSYSFSFVPRTPHPSSCHVWRIQMTSIMVFSFKFLHIPCAYITILYIHFKFQCYFSRQLASTWHTLWKVGLFFIVCLRSVHNCLENAPYIIIIIYHSALER